jgi:hypothetical protein
MVLKRINVQRLWLPAANLLNFRSRLSKRSRRFYNVAMRMPPVHLTWKKPLLFWGLFALPLASMIAAFRIEPAYGLYYLISLACAFFVLLSLMESFASGWIESNWGRLDKKTQPVRYWLQIGIWVGMYICATAFPITIALQQPHV